MAMHKDRTHTTLSPSGAHRWKNCTAAPLLEAQFPDKDSPYAAEGTMAHELCELMLRNYTEATPRREQTKRIDEFKKRDGYSPEMLSAATAYQDYIKAAILECNCMPHIAIERELDLNLWIPNGKGIADCILICGSRLQVIDFKYGKGIPVSANANPQLALYALGAYAAYQMIYNIDEVRLTIVQPRISDEVSSWDCLIDDLLAWGEIVKERAEEALSGNGVFRPSVEACRFCKAKQVCRARAEQNLQMAFGDNPPVGTKPDTLTPDEIGTYLKHGEDVARWVEELKDYALAQALNGHPITGYKAVEGRGSRDWTDREAAFKAIVDAGTPETMLYETSPLSLAQVEKVIGKAVFHNLVGEYVVKRPGKPTLVPESDKREAISNVTKASDVFN